MSIKKARTIYVVSEQVINTLEENKDLIPFYKWALCAFYTDSDANKHIAELERGNKNPGRTFVKEDIDLVPASIRGLTDDACFLDTVGIQNHMPTEGI